MSMTRWNGSILVLATLVAAGFAGLAILDAGAADAPRAPVSLQLEDSR